MLVNNQFDSDPNCNTQTGHCLVFRNLSLEQRIEVNLSSIILNLLMHINNQW